MYHWPMFQLEIAAMPPFLETRPLQPAERIAADCICPPTVALSTAPIGLLEAAYMRQFVNNKPQEMN